MNFFKREMALWQLKAEYKGNLSVAKDYVEEARSFRAEGDNELAWDALDCAQRARTTALNALTRYRLLSQPIPGVAYS